MKKIVPLLLYLSLYTAPLYTLHGEPDYSDRPVLSFGGFVRHSTICDTRQTISDNEGVSALFPLPRMNDIYGKDIYGRGQFDMINLQTRLHTDIRGPKIGERTTTRGYIEVDFQGRMNIGDLVRMRHAFIVLEWPRFIFLAGQTDNPMFLNIHEPNTIAVDQGAPFNPYGRNPQIQLRYTRGLFSFVGTALTQLDKTSDGPIGLSSTYLRDAIVPNLDAQIQLQTTNLFFASSVNFKRLVPRLSSTVNNNLFKVYESINSWSAFAFLEILLPQKNTRVKTKMVYSQNLREYDTFSGYAIKSVDPITGKQTYTNLQQIGWWADIDVHYNCWFNPGLFVGFTKNIGFTSPVADDLLINGAVEPALVFARAPTIDFMIDIRPRAYWYVKQLTIGAELQYDYAAFGTIKQNGAICNPTGVQLLRAHVVLMYNF